jgi:hypothetical protein
MYAITGLGRAYDVAKGGRFLMMRTVPVVQEVRMVFNWLEEVNARVKPR